MIPLIRTSYVSLLFLALKTSIAVASASNPLDACPGYNAVNIQATDTDLTADLILAGEPCGIYGEEIKKLSLLAQYQSDSRIYIKITDPENTRYEVPEHVFPRPARSESAKSSAIKLRFTPSPFSFGVVRTDTGEVLFDTSDHPLIFSPQYLRLKTSLPPNANIYGLGEHTDSFRLSLEDTTRTLWARDSPGIPTGTNLYGAHPVYFEHRTTGTHGVFLLNSNGMDIKLEQKNGKASLEYNVIGGIFELYFFAGPTPLEVARQYAEVAGLPAEMPYWSFGLHQCRWGYKDIDEVQQVIANYSAAGIPLETMWIDIDYMNDRLVFTTDPVAYPKDKLRSVVADLHSKDQHFIMMVDPAIGTRPGQAGAFDRGTDEDVWLKDPDGKAHIGIVWPGTTVFPDWFHPSAQAYWNKEFDLFFNPENGFNIDGVWIDMNEPASFCYDPCVVEKDSVNVTELMLTLGEVPPLEDAPEYKKNAKGLNLRRPPYAIKNDFPRLSDRTAPVDAVHYGGILEYDAHNLYGSMMSIATRNAMLSRRSELRPFVITRSTFAGIGSKVGKWLGDNVSDWVQYRFSITGMLGFTSIYQVPMVGSDVCGFVDNTTETLCARWAMLGAFSPFYRNHNDIASIPQEFYRWPTVARAAKAAIEIRYKLLDYLYTAFHKAHIDGTPVVQPLFFSYPKDSNTFGIEHQFFFGDAVMVCPVLEEGNEVEIYLPDDIYYELVRRRSVYGPGSKMWVRQVEIDEIPLLIRGGKIIPMRIESAMTTTELRKKDFEIVVAPGIDGTARGSLYVDDGVSLEQERTLEASYMFDGTKLSVSSTGHYNTGVQYAKISILGVDAPPDKVYLTLADGTMLQTKKIQWDSENEVLNIETGLSMSKSFELELFWQPEEQASQHHTEGKEHYHDEL
ncbi:hypothetical protein CPB86DRAFT_753322 [Serendipita vermifera]|nr:hypothetical protein CPB86DRAFT_753322 [Serendipita vermifera]